RPTAERDPVRHADTTDVLLRSVQLHAGRRRGDDSLEHADSGDPQVLLRDPSLDGGNSRRSLITRHARDAVCEKPRLGLDGLCLAALARPPPDAALTRRPRSCRQRSSDAARWWILPGPEDQPKSIGSEPASFVFGTSGAPDRRLVTTHNAIEASMRLTELMSAT